jgi:O-antigen ligase/polysaccharide polymerase Wzy-like membrane protein
VSSRPAMIRVERALHTDAWFAIAVAAVSFVLAYDQGGYSIGSRSASAIAVWWAILLGVGLAYWPRARPTREAAVVGGLLAAFAAWTFASIWWASSAEGAFVEFNRVALYLGIFCVAVLAGTRANVGRWADGLALGIAAIGVVALLSRLFPHLFSHQGLPVFLPGVQRRLSFPIGYWNGLGAYLGLCYPLLLRLALVGRASWTRALALAPLPAVSAAIYLTSSRGGVATAVLGVIVFLVTTADRWRALGALATTGLGSIVAIAWLLPRHELVDGPVQSSVAVSQGRSAFFLILLTCVATACVYAAGERFLGTARPAPVVGKSVVVALIVAAAIGLAFSDPAHRFNTFKQTPAQTRYVGGFVQSHLLSGSGNGRWQFWTAAIKEFESAPFKGRGAGSFESWWAQHAPFSYFIRNAHSLYLEALGELGIVGFLLLVAAFVYGAVTACRRVVAAENDERITASALLGILVAFYLAAGIDWIWQLTAVSLVGVVALGLLVGPATLATIPVETATRARRLRAPRYAPVVAMLIVGWLVICTEAIPWFVDIQLGSSAAAVRRADTHGALRDALSAKKLEPWASSPYLQLALVEEQAGDLAAARSWIEKAIHRDELNWRLWLVATRIETKSGDLTSARRSLERAAALNPRSPLFAGIPRAVSG